MLRRPAAVEVGRCVRPREQLAPSPGPPSSQRAEEKFERDGEAGRRLSSGEPKRSCRSLDSVGVFVCVWRRFHLYDLLFGYSELANYCTMILDKPCNIRSVVVALQLLSQRDFGNRRVLLSVLKTLRAKNIKYVSCSVM